MPEPVFAKGLFLEKKPGSPDFVICRLSVKCKDFYEFMKEHVNEKGYINIQVKESKGGKIYAELDTWEPNKKNSTLKPPDDMGFGPDDDMPF